MTDGNSKKSVFGNGTLKTITLVVGLLVIFSSVVASYVKLQSNQDVISSQMAEMCRATNEKIETLKAGGSDMAVRNKEEIARVDGRMDVFSVEVKGKIELFDNKMEQLQKDMDNLRIESKQQFGELKTLIKEKGK